MITAGQQMASQANANNNKIIFGPILINVKTFGAFGDGKHDDSANINAAIAYSQSFGPYQSVIVEFPGGNYFIKSPIIVPHGTEANRVHLMGYNATLSAGTIGMDMIQVVAKGSPLSFLNLGQTRIFGFRLEGNGRAKRGILVGKDNADPSSYGVGGVFKSIVRDVDIRDCTQAGIEISDSRLWQFENCTVDMIADGAIGINITAINDSTCTDMWFINSQIAVPGTNVANVCVKMTASKVTTGSSMGGFHFTDCVFYGQAVRCEAKDNLSAFADMFFTDCANDGLSTNAGFYGFYFKAIQKPGSGVILFNNTWVNAHNIGVYLENLVGCQFHGGKVSSTSFQAILFNGTNDSTIEGAKFFDVNTVNNSGGSINISNPGSRNKIRGNSIFNATGHSSVNIYIGSDQVKPIVTENTTDSGTCVTNGVVGTPGVDYVVANNLDG